MDSQEQITLKEKELLLKEKEIELRERELRLKEKEFQQAEEKKQKVEDVFNTVKQRITPSRNTTTTRTGLFSLREADNANIFSSEGVLGRKGFLLFTIPYSLLYYVITGVLGKIASDPTIANIPFLVFYFAIIVVGTVPTIFACIKRCRDCELNAWWMILFSFIPFAGLYLLFAKPVANLDNYTISWETYRQSDEYKETQDRAKYVLWTILIILVLIILIPIARGL